MRTAIPFFAFCLLGLSNTVLAGSEALAYTDQVFEIGGVRHKLRVPQGFQLELLTDKLDDPRLLTFADNGDLYVGTRAGVLYRLAPPYTSAQVLVSLDDYPQSVAFRRGEILIARTSGLYRAPYQPGQLTIPGKSITLLALLPGGNGHASRSVGVGPDQRVYVGLGIQGNCSDQYLSDGYIFNDRRGGILVLSEQQGRKPTWETFASGLRNPIGFAWHPQTGVLYATNNGPDHLGFEQPPEYFSRLTPGSFHGMPWFQFDGKRLKADNCVSSKPPQPITATVTPVATFPSRSAPMGVAFVPKGALHKTLESDAIVALHGSWATQPGGGALGNKDTRRPPKIVVVRFKDGAALRVDDLITGFQSETGARWARPVGVAVGPDGALYFSSDSATNGLFRLRRK